MLPRIEPVLPSRDEFHHVQKNPHLYVYELKMDGFRGVAYVDQARVELSTRRKNLHKGFADIRNMLKALPVRNVILDGEIVCLGENGKPDFNALMRRDRDQYYYAFDLLYMDGQDFRHKPLIERKKRLHDLAAKAGANLHVVDAFPDSKALDLIKIVQKHDLEGLVAKLSAMPYDPSIPNNWVKVINPNYSQFRDRWKRFKDRS